MWMSCKAIADLRVKIVREPATKQDIIISTSRHIVIMQQLSNGRPALTRINALAKREDTSWRLDSLMSQLVSRQHQRNSSLLLTLSERIQRHSSHWCLRLAIVASTDSSEQWRWEKRTLHVLAVLPEINHYVLDEWRLTSWTVVH